MKNEFLAFWFFSEFFQTGRCFLSCSRVWYFYQFRSLFPDSDGKAGQAPWSGCGHEWNSECCSTVFVNGSLILPENCTSGRPIFPEQEFWSNRVLDITAGITEPGNMRWELIGCLLAMWIIVYASISKGAKSVGKAAYIYSSFPLIMLLILVVRGLTLEGKIRRTLHCWLMWEGDSKSEEHSLSR